MYKSALEDRSSLLAETGVPFGKGLMKPEKTSQLSGIFAPTITGYHSDGSISLEGTRKFVRFLLNSGADGLTPLGSAGEPVALTLEERKSLLEAIVAENASQVPIYAGTGDYGTEATIELSLHAKSLGCDGLMLIAPFFLRPPKKDVLNHFRRVRERVGLPIMVYNVPLLTGTEITPQEIKMLYDEDVVHAVKWSHLEVARIHDTRLLCGPDFPIFAGIDVIAFEAMAVGADGWISGLPMIVPALARRLHRLLAVEKNLHDARALWYRVTKKIAAISETHYVSVALHNCRGPLGTVIAMHLCANIPNFQILETFEDYDVPWRCDLTPGTPRVKDGFYELPTRPGWGVDVDEKLIAAHPENPDAKLNMFKSGWEQQMCK